MAVGAGPNATTLGRQAQTYNGNLTCITNR